MFINVSTATTLTVHLMDPSSRACRLCYQDSRIHEMREWTGQITETREGKKVNDRKDNRKTEKTHRKKRQQKDRRHTERKDRKRKDNTQKEKTTERQKR